MSNKHILYLALGTNLGNRKANLREAIEMLPPGVEVVAVSRLYETAPAYVIDQPTFLNLALKGQTRLGPVDLLAYLKKLEENLGRRKTRRYGPRKIDLDIIFYDDLILDTPELKIPHLRLAERDFVLRPLVDIAADVVHPRLQQSVAELVAQLPPNDGILSVTAWQ